MTTREIEEHDNTKTLAVNTQELKKEKKEKKGGNSQPQPLCNLCLHSCSNPLLPFSSSILSRCQFSRIPMAVHFLTSASHCTPSNGHDCHGLQCFAVKGSVYYILLAVVQNPTLTEWLFSVPWVTPTPSPHVLFFFHSAGPSWLFPCCLSLLFSRHEQGPLTSCFHLV